MATLMKFEKVEKHIALITLNRPKAANSLSKALLQELDNIIDQVNQDKSIYCTIITGAGDKVFSAGADLKERKGMNDEEVISAVRYIGQTIDRIEKMDMPVIAMINGAAYGGGLELALACDFRLSANDVKLGLTEASLAIIPGAGGTQRLPRIIGESQAKRLIFTAQPIDASEALNIGIVEQITDKDALYDVSINLAKEITQNGPIALKQAKRAINQGLQTDITNALEIEHACYKETIPTKDRIEGLTAFKEKRKPIYHGE